jgi:MFS transporter, FSR family, fosmidomycin resistance protein
MDRREKRIVALIGCAHALTHGYLLIFPAVLLLLQKEFSIGYLTLGVISNIMNLTYGLGALPGGLIYNRLGPKKLFFLCFLGSSIACILVAISPSLIFFTLALGLLGALGSVYHPMANALIAGKVREYGKAMGIHGAVGNLGLALAPFIAGIFGSLLGWRYTYACFALPGIVLAIWACFVDMSPSTESQRDSKPTATRKSSPRDFWIYFSLPLILLYLANMLHGSCSQGAITFLPTFLAKRTSFHIFSLDPVAMGGTLSGIVLFLGVFGQYGGGMLAQKPHLERNFLFVSLLVFPSILSLSFVTDVALLVLAPTYFILNFFLQPMNNTLLAHATSSEMRGTAFGIFFFTAFAVGSFASSFSGYVAETFGLRWVYLGLGSSAFLLIWVAFFLLRLKKNRFPASSPGGI